VVVSAVVREIQRPPALSPLSYASPIRRAAQKSAFPFDVVKVPNTELVNSSGPCGLAEVQRHPCRRDSSDALRALRPDHQPCLSIRRGGRPRGSRRPSTPTQREGICHAAARRTKREGVPLRAGVLAALSEARGHSDAPDTKSARDDAIRLTESTPLSTMRRSSPSKRRRAVGGSAAVRDPTLRQLRAPIPPIPSNASGRVFSSLAR
jgi:hypothetical protein